MQGPPPPFPIAGQFPIPGAPPFPWPAFPGAPPMPFPVVTPGVQVSNFPPNNPIAAAAAAAADAAQAQKKANMLPMQGNVEKANMDDRLWQNIQDCNFYKSLFEYKTYEEIIEKAEDSAKYINAWGDHAATQKRGSHMIVAAASGAAHLAGMRGWVHQHHQPSPAWCLMYKLHTLRVTKDQVEGMLGHANPCVRCMALVYLRLVLPPIHLWEYFEDHVNDQEELLLTDKPNVRFTKVSEVAVNLLLELKYLDTRFPRIAEAHMRNIRAALAKKGIDAGVSDIGLVSQRVKRDEPPVKKRGGRPDLDDGPDERKRSRPDDDQDDRPRKRSTRPDLDDVPDRSRQRNGDSRYDRERDRDRWDRDRERDRDRARDRENDRERDRDRDWEKRPSDERSRRDDKDKDRRRRESSRERRRSRERDRKKKEVKEAEEDEGSPDSSKRAKPDQLTTTLAKLKSVYGDLSASGGGAAEADAKASGARKNYLGSEKITLGGRAWGQ
eukprot:GGOE01058915.1.p1 GENE.GGOE01058915.1~~GGOE01058915.1.p1  ORF type:complete len:496 (-),score=91.83 GGOE01058915.1:359-1846(-)